MHAFTLAEEGTPREKELLRAVPDGEAMMQMLGKVRISGLPATVKSGSNKTNGKSQSQKKSGKKKK